MRVANAFGIAVQELFEGELKFTIPGIGKGKKTQKNRPQFELGPMDLVSA